MATRIMCYNTNCKHNYKAWCSLKTIEISATSCVDSTIIASAPYCVTYLESKIHLESKQKTNDKQKTDIN